MDTQMLTNLNLQRFAEENPATTEQAGQSEDTETSKNTGDDEKNETKMLSITQDELDEILNKRLARQEEKLEKKFKAEKEEELRKSKLSQAEKEAEERKELQDEEAKEVNIKSFEDGTSNSNRFGPRHEIKSTDANVHYDKRLYIYEGTNLFI